MKTQQQTQHEKPGRRGRWIGSGLLLATSVAFGWTPVPVADDPLLFMPGSQPANGISLSKLSSCTKCHGNFNPVSEPYFGLNGSMMGQAARDPLWLACLAVADQDSIWAVGTPNAGDLCIRCHSPSGWLAGRSDPPNASALDASQGDFEGLTCAFCHQMADPFTTLRQPDVPPEGPTGQTAADATHALDLSVLNGVSLFTGESFLDPETGLPRKHLLDDLRHYIESTAGQYFVDPSDNRRGPRLEGNPNHAFDYSRYHQSKTFCGTCHDVSNPVLANLTIAPDASSEQTAASYFHVERTFSEFQLSAYAAPGGAPTNPPIAARGVPHASRCQDCHMARVEGPLCNKNNVPVRSDAASHSLTGGNAWMSRILASVDQSTGNPAWDPYNHAILSGAKFSGASIDVPGLQGSAEALLAGAGRAEDNLAVAASLVPVREDTRGAVLRIINNTGHKLISGFPEGRRMWLHVRFVDPAGDSTAFPEINPYDPLVTGVDGGGNETYVSGGLLHKTREDLVYEAKMSSSLTGEDETFHFVLATDRKKDNRIPPRGFDLSRSNDRLAQPRWEGADAPDYFSPQEYAGGYDQVGIAKPPGAAGWVATLYYQTTSLEYVQFLRDEINGTANSLTSPTPSGEPDAYVIQSPSGQNATFFQGLRGWGDALWDLWLHNGGAAPIRMTSAISPPTGLTVSDDPAGVRIGFDTIVGRSYQVETSPTLGNTSWSPIGHLVVGDGTRHELIHTPDPNADTAFYRVAGTLE